MSDEAVEALSKVHGGKEVFNPTETEKLEKAYYWVDDYF
jgi:hypothetical protein